MAADGLPARFGNITEVVWCDLVERAAETLDIGPGTQIFEVGCGAGAFLYPLFENGFVVGGIDPSDARLRLAAEAMPAGRWSHGDAASLDPGEPWDVVVASAAFADFPDLDYARGVLARMAAKAGHAVAVLDVPDLDTRGDTRGGEAPRLYYDRGWMLRALAEIGVKAVQIEDHRIEGHANARGRFNVFARL